MMDPERLWAKSKQKNESQKDSMLLTGHLKDVYTAAVKILEMTGDDQLRAVGLDPDHYRDRLRRSVLIAAALHDLGKANDHFQPMVRGKRDVRVNPQGLRHEWVTVLLLQELKEWLLPAVGEDFNIVEWAVSGHHPAAHHCSPPRLCPPGAGTDIQFLVAQEDFRRSLEWLKQTFSLGEIPKLNINRRNLVGPNNVFGKLGEWERESRRLWVEKFLHKAEARFVAVVKSCLIAADVAGSALPSKVSGEGSINWGWIGESFKAKPGEGDLQSVVKKRLGEETPRPFQEAVANSKSAVTFVKAGCGSGKTLAAYLWAARKHPTRRLYFCYPTTGTATEGFKDYLHEADVNAKLFHSRRDIDFEIILETGPDTQDSETEAAIRIDSLEAWSTPIVSCTVDTVLGLVQNNRRGVYAWPALAKSAFVFDEIHAFDDRLFGALLRFLRDLPGLPALLMTASLPNARREALREALQKRGEELVTIHGPESLEKLPRYHKTGVPKNDPLPLIEATLKQGGKVLWVCNTVNRVMEGAARAVDRGMEPMVYHSRFKYFDRVQRHKDVISAFDSQSPGPQLAICSQVAEMSLDLKGCTLLVTDKASVPAMIQRLGRLNRQAAEGSPTCPFVVIEPENHQPYTPHDLMVTDAWLAKLPETEISQRDLSEGWEQEGDQLPELVPSAWLDGGPITTVSELRESSPGITIIMEKDREVVGKSAKAVPRYTLPMPPPPKGLDWKNWGKVHGIPVAPQETISYDPLRGASWRK